MIERLEAGKRYIWTGLKTDPDSWLPGLDGEPHTCVFASKDGRHARFAGQPHRITAYYYGDVLDRISEVPAPGEYMPIGTPVRLTAEGRKHHSSLCDIKRGVGTICEVDHPDPIRPYRVKFTDEGRRWCGAADIERIPDDTTPKVCDRQWALARSAPFVESLGHIDPYCASTTRQGRRREIRRKLLGL